MGSNRALCRHVVRRQRAQLAHHSPLPASTDCHTLEPVVPHGSEGQCPHQCTAKRLHRAWMGF